MSCSIYASPETTPVTMASIPGENRLVVIILRGGMDGLSVVQPIGDPHFSQWRGNTDLRNPNTATDLDGFFALHPCLSQLAPLWKKEQLAFAHAVSTPYRDKRSHFDGQDLLEAGIPNFDNGRIRDGWLNRIIQAMPGATGETAFAVGTLPLSILAGDAEVSRWAPAADLVLRPKTLELTKGLMARHPLFDKAMAGISSLLADDAPLDTSTDESDPEAMVQLAMQLQVRNGRTGEAIARFAAKKLKGDTRIAAFSIGEWDTHARQSKSIEPPLRDLCQAILTLEAELGGLWEKTTVVAMTEFGRTVYLNGTNGTDHGTAGAMLFAGGALKGRRVLADWPGPEEADLYDRRDLYPTRDVRDYSAWFLRSLFGFNKSFLETSIFPGLQMTEDPKLVL